jgi:hypothetical protein
MDSTTPLSYFVNPRRALRKIQGKLAQVQQRHVGSPAGGSTPRSGTEGLRSEVKLACPSYLSVTLQVRGRMLSPRTLAESTAFQNNSDAVCREVAWSDVKRGRLARSSARIKFLVLRFQRCCPSRNKLEGKKNPHAHDPCGRLDVEAG